MGELDRNNGMTRAEALRRASGNDTSHGTRLREIENFQNNSRNTF